MDPMFVRVAMSNPPRSVKMNNFIIMWDDNIIYYYDDVVVASCFIRAAIIP